MFPFDFGVSVIQFNVYFFEWKDIMLLSNRRETQKQKHMETNSTAVANLQLEFSKSDRDFVLYVVDTYIEKHFEESSNVYLEKEFIAERAWDHVCKNAQQYVPGEASFKTWERKVVTNHIKDEAKRLNKHPKREFTQESNVETEEDYELFDLENLADPNDCKGDICDQIDCYDAYELVKLVVSSLSGPNRTVADLLLEEKTIEEISAETNMECGYIRTCKSRVFKKLRTELQRAGYNYAA